MVLFQIFLLELYFTRLKFTRYGEHTFAKLYKISLANFLMVKEKKSVEKSSKTNKAPETIKIVRERDIALDFGLKVYEKFDQLIKSIILFGSVPKKKSGPKSDIDIIIIIDDVSVRWDEELISWYREELGKIISSNPYRKPLHVNSVKLSTWWADIMRGDPVVLNVLRYGEAVIDYGGFFSPLKVLLKEGKIKSTPEAIFTLLERAPMHLRRAYQSLLNAVDGIYWAFVDSAHSLMIAYGISPPSPEDIGDILYEEFTKKKMLDKKFVNYYDEIFSVAKEIIHGKNREISGENIDEWAQKANKFIQEMTRLIKNRIEEMKRS